MDNSDAVSSWPYTNGAERFHFVRFLHRLESVPHGKSISTPFASMITLCSTQSESAALQTLAFAIRATAKNLRSSGSNTASIIGWGTSAHSPPERLLADTLITLGGQRCKTSQ